MRSAPRCERVSVLDRILAVLEAVRDQGGSSTVAQLSARTGIPKSTVSRLVADLVRQRYLARAHGRVVIGLRLFELGARATTPRRLRAASLPVLAELHSVTGEHLTVAVQDGRDMLSIVSVRGRLHPAPSHAGARVPSVTTALGKAVLAFAVDSASVDSLVCGLARAQRAQLEREFPVIRSGGVAVDRGQTFPGVIGVASPVLSVARVPVAAISAAGPAGEMDPARIVPLIRHAALVLTRRLAATADA